MNTSSYTLRGFSLADFPIMNALQLLLFLFIVFNPFYHHWNRFSSVENPTRVIAQNTCQEWINQLTKEVDWEEQLINPMLTSAEQVAVRYNLYAQVHRCLEADSASLANEYKTIYMLTDYFLIFIEGYETTTDTQSFLTIDPATSNDKAIVKIRDEAGISPPQGYIFARLFPSREAMPASLQSIFKNEQVEGVTIFARYVAVLAEDKKLWGERLLQSMTLPETISHELVHAYVNARIGYENYSKLPTWYEEGIAIYFSGSGKNHTIVTPNLTITTTSPADYQQYENNFNFLEAMYGRKQLLALINASINQADPSILYVNLKLDSDEAFIATASSWKNQRDNTHLGISLMLIILIGAGVTIWWKRYPDAWCIHCDYGGKWKDFKDGVCPRCQHPYNNIDSP